MMQEIPQDSEDAKNHAVLKAALRRARILGAIIGASVGTVILAATGAWKQIQDRQLAFAMDVSTSMALQRLDAMGYPAYEKSSWLEYQPGTEKTIVSYREDGVKRTITVARDAIRPNICDTLCALQTRIDFIESAAIAGTACLNTGYEGCPVGASGIVALEFPELIVDQNDGEKFIMRESVPAMVSALASELDIIWPTYQSLRDAYRVEHCTYR